jgi:hypothetical protein
VTNFKKRQYSDSYERVKRYRERYSNVTEEDAEALHPSSSSSSSISYSDSLEEEGVGGETILPIPTTPKQAVEHPDIQLYKKITNGFPGRGEYRSVVETIQHLRKEHGSNLTEYLMPFWTAWSTRKGKNGKAYNPASMVWLYEWAMQGRIPSANGHEPQSGELTNTQDVIKKVAQHAKRNS